MGTGVGGVGRGFDGPGQPGRPGSKERETVIGLLRYCPRRIHAPCSSIPRSSEPGIDGLLHRDLRPLDGGRLWCGVGGAATNRRRRDERLRRTYPPCSGGGVLHDGFLAFLGGLPSAGRFFWQVLLFCIGGALTSRQPRLALAGGPGNRYERGIPLLFPAGAQKNLRG